MDELLRKLAELPDVKICIGSGIEHWRTGEVTLSVRGHGEVEVRQLQGGAERTYHARLEAAQIYDFGAALADLDFTRLRDSAEVREPDDVPVWFVIYRGEAQLHYSKLWYGDRYEDTQLDGILKRYEELVSEVTDGFLPYGKSE
jgi:hypothetical protein